MQAKPMPSRTLIDTLIMCFSLASATSFFTQLREPKLVPLRVLLATGVYTGMSAVAIASLWIHYAGGDRAPTMFLWFVSIAAGLGNVDFLVAIWNKVLVSGANFLWEKVTGKPLVTEKMPEDPRV